MKSLELSERIIEEKIEKALTMPLPDLINKIFNNAFYCSSTGKKIEKSGGYYSEITLRVYHSKEIAQKEIAHYLNEKGIYEVRGMNPYKLRTIKELGELRKKFLLIENNNKFKAA